MQDLQNVACELWNQRSKPETQSFRKVWRDLRLLASVGLKVGGSAMKMMKKKEEDEDEKMKTWG